MRRFISANRERLRGGDYAALYDWSIERPRSSGRQCGGSAEVAQHRPYRRCCATARACRARNGSRRAAQLRREPARARRERNRDRVRQRARRALRSSVGRSSRPSRERRGSLRALGVRKATASLAFIANRPEAVVAMLATASLGAVWSSCSPDFGIDAVLDRFGQIQPKVLFATDGYFYSGKSIDSLPTVRAVAARLPRLAAVVVVPYRDAAPDLSGVSNASLFGELLANRASLAYEPTAFDDPFFILYSSGTTGVPKCIVHGVGGTLLQHRKEHVLHTDIRPRRRRVLLHDVRLDDVELARLGARVGRDARAVRRRTAPPRSRRPLAARGARERHRLRHEREVL